MVEDDSVKSSEEEKIKKYKAIKTFIINLFISFIILLIIGLLVYFKYVTLLPTQEIAELKEMAAGLGNWGIAGLVFTFVFFIMGIVTAIYYRKKFKKGEITKDVSKTITFYLICLLAAIMVCYPLFQSGDIKYNLYIFILAFALCCIFFKLFSNIDYKNFHRLLSFPLALIFRFFIPMLLIWVIFLGAINGLYNPESTFLTQVAGVFGSDQYITLQEGGSLGGIIGFGCYKFVSIIYLMGFNSPHSMLILCVLTTLFLLFLTIYKHFIQGIPAMSFIDDQTESEAKEAEEESLKVPVKEEDSDEEEKPESAIDLNRIIDVL